MAYNLENKIKTDKLIVNDFLFEILSEKTPLEFYCWSDENATLSNKKVALKRVNFNLSENDFYHLQMTLSDFQLVAKHGDYLIFANEDNSTYVVVCSTVNHDYNNDFAIKNPSAKAVECSFVENKLTFSIKDVRMLTQYACILDMWFVCPQERDISILQEIIDDLCL